MVTRDSPASQPDAMSMKNKRPSPDTDPMRSLSSQRKSKRAKIEAIQLLGHSRQAHSEYREPLRDSDTPLRFKPYTRASSTKPTSSPSKPTSSIPRAQSLPLGGEDQLRTVDFTTIPPSPRRSPSKDAIQIQRAPSVPPPDGNQMNVDVDDTAALLQFTNPTHVTTPRENPPFCYTVNFATPRGSTSPRRSFTSPLSPLTPLPASPPTEFLPEMQSFLAKKATAKLLAFNNKNKDASTNVVPSTAATAQPPAHVPSTSRSRSPSVISSSSAVSQPRLARIPLTSTRSMDLMPPPAAPQRKVDPEKLVSVVGRSGQPKVASSSNSGGLAKASTSGSVDLSSGPTLRVDSNPMSIPRPGIIGAMKPKRGPSVHQGPKRVTRSVSVKEQRVKTERTEMEDITAAVTVTTTNTDAGSSSGVTSTSLLPQSTGDATAKTKPPLAARAARRSVSASKVQTDSSKLRQTSLATFVKGKPPTTGSIVTPGGSGSAAPTSTGAAGGVSRVAPSSSPSKIPVPASRPMTQPGNNKPSFFSLANTGGTGISRGTIGRSLTTLSHALDKLAAPPPSRPNTSMGFVRMDQANEDDSSSEIQNKGKRKAKDDTSLPMASAAQGSGTFARPTASSLKRASTVTGFGSMAVARMRGRVGTMIGGSGRGRGVVGIFNKVGDRASKKTSLPVVMGSPVKGSGTAHLDSDDQGTGVAKLRLGFDIAGERDIFMPHIGAALPSRDQDAVIQDVFAESSKGGGRSAAARKSSSPQTVAKTNDVMDIDPTTSPVSVDKGKQRAMASSTLNPASSALHALSESLSSLPQTPTPPKPRAIGTRTGLRSSTAVGKESPTGVFPGGSSDVHGSGGAGPGSGTVNGSGGVKKSSLKILKRCIIFVDVRTEQGDDAGSLFVDMLKGLGAKIMSRLGSRCTHIVYKNGHPHTLTRYRMLNDPKPVVIGIAWVVECVEKRAKVDEDKFKIDVDLINVAGNHHKRRRSIFPKHLIPVSPGPDYDMPINMSSEADDEDDGAGTIDESLSQDPDLSMRSREEEDLPPLERARRRRSILPGGQTRLIL